jgi:hypothetical protein
VASSERLRGGAFAWTHRRMSLRLFRGANIKDIGVSAALKT